MDTRSAELRRRAYLDAMGVLSYVPRQPLPNARAAPRLAVRRMVADTVAPKAAPSPVIPATARVPETAPVARHRGQSPAAPEADKVAHSSIRFTVAVTLLGGWLWLDDIGERALAAQYPQLMKAIGVALFGGSAAPACSSFTWPLHDNPQLDGSAQAAQAALSEVVRRRLAEGSCVGVVLLGNSDNLNLPDAPWAGLPVVSTLSAARLLLQPASKAQVWRDLQVLRHAPQGQ